MSHPKPCPNCGHCPTCGRSNFRPWYPYWSVTPYWQPLVWSTGAGNSTNPSVTWTGYTSVSPTGSVQTIN